MNVIRTVLETDDFIVHFKSQNVNINKPQCVLLLPGIEPSPHSLQLVMLESLYFPPGHGSGIGVLDKLADCMTHCKLYGHYCTQVELLV